MIPKIIHWCWLSNDPYPQKIQNCLKTWNTILPDYEIRLWNLSNINLDEIPWLRKAFENHEWALISDYVRCFVLFNFGGIYFDSDVEVVKKFDDLLGYKSFIGYEYMGSPEAAVVGAEKGCEWIGKCCEWYKSAHFMENGQVNRVIAPLVMKSCYEKHFNVRLCDDGKIHINENHLIVPYDYFSPKCYYNGKIYKTENTYCIHNFNASWYKNSLILRLKKLFHIVAIHFLGKITYNKILYKIRSRGDHR